MAQKLGEAVCFLFLFGLGVDPAQNLIKYKRWMFIQQQNLFCNSYAVYDYKSKDVQGH